MIAPLSCVILCMRGQLLCYSYSHSARFSRTADFFAYILISASFTLLACNDQQRMSLFRKWRSMLQPIDPKNFPPPGPAKQFTRLLSFLTHWVQFSTTEPRS